MFTIHKTGSRIYLKLQLYSNANRRINELFYHIQFDDLVGSYDRHLLLQIVIIIVT